MQHTNLENLKDELATVELDQRFEMVNAGVMDGIIDIENFICKPNPQPTPEAPN